MFSHLLQGGAQWGYEDFFLNFFYYLLTLVIKNKYFQNSKIK